MAKQDTSATISNERWVRLPRPGQRELTTGLSRATLHLLISQGKIKSSSLQRPGTVRGVRLIWLPSLLDYVERHSEGGEVSA